MSREENRKDWWRIFCAVELPEEVRRSAAAHAARLRESAPHVRAGWDKPEKMHVTLKFLGEIEPERVARLESAAQRATGDLAPFNLAVEGAGAFPPHGAPRVLWLGIRDDEGALSRLQQRLEDECAREGFPKESKSFHPHLTIARLRTPTGARELTRLHREAQFSSAPFLVSELLVIRSELAPVGSRYTTLSRHPLNRKPPDAGV